MMLHIIVNERAGNGRAKKMGAAVCATLTTDYHFYTTKAPHHATAIVEKIAQFQGKQLCLIIGGDGTIHEAIQGAIGHDNIIIGVMNGGSGNDFGRGFSAFTTAADIESFLVKPSITTEDTGLLMAHNQHSFMNNIGYGVDAKIVYEVNRTPLKNWLNRIGLGQLTYAILLMKEVLTFKPFDVTVTHGATCKVYKNVWITTVSNQPFIGGGMKISPHSITNDGRLELTIVENLSRLKLLMIFGTIFKGRHLAFTKHVSQISADAFTIMYSEPIQGHADGEDIGQSSDVVRIEIQPQSFRLARRMLD
ncbi:diacylglycerol/lipid kinase family protein [Kurthia huakuii]|uniref:diacylglycerol/lipid kinase family protein n=1 Tax=Kurthia huakuii TaxID=1421019 RepID=UPI0004967E22|nr:diacylglycerol kinase family protein [Kurthia huakuii]MBM7697743.1 YegS/Rv2252/BmrU family lipid kinase [Kurthia huakuii]